MAGGKKASKNSPWPLPQPIEEGDQDIRANAISLLKTTKQWLTAADSGGLPSPDRLSSFLVAVIPLTTMVQDDDVLAELQRIRKLLAEMDQKHSDSITHLSHAINLANTRQVPAGGAHALSPVITFYDQEINLDKGSVKHLKALQRSVEITIHTRNSDKQDEAKS